MFLEIFLVLLLVGVNGLLAMSELAVVGHVCGLFTEDECYNFFKAAGYETN